MTVSEGAGKQRGLFVLQDSYVWSPVKLHVATASSEEDTKGSDVATLLSTYVKCYMLCEVSVNRQVLWIRDNGCL